jgi:hypothetical protein
LKDKRHAKQVLENFDSIIAMLPRDSSVDAYLYCNGGKLHLGVSMLRCSTTEVDLEALPLINEFVHGVIGQEKSSKIVDAVGLFDTEMYMSAIHGGHGGGKPCSFKRCVFLEDSAMTDAISVLIAAIQDRPSSLCYFHLLHGGRAIGDIAPDATDFGCREWHFACVITGVWSCYQYDTAVTQNIIR